MTALTALAAILAALSPAQDEESPLGLKKVNVRAGKFYESANPRGPVVRKAVYGEEVKVTEVKGSFSKVVLGEGREAYIAASALIPREKFKPEAANEEELGKLTAQGYEAGRFDPETEKKYREQKGPAMDAAYKQLEALEARAFNRGDAAAVEQVLKDFRRDGRLGEFANVK